MVISHVQNTENRNLPGIEDGKDRTQKREKGIERTGYNVKGHPNEE